ncbi:membrane protein YczE [Actinokineospora sp.]|uniref:membrane protein YczE n=1 Tax=Actinokineospora sp. TaxID=1872133 RepID=UPI0040376C94
MSANLVRMPLVGRLVRLYLGLVAFGVSLALMVRADLGLGPWDVLHQGIARHLNVRIGLVTIAVSALVLIAWIGLRQRPGLGTVSNVVLVGFAVDVTLDVVPDVGALPARIALLVAGVLLNAFATGLYIGADFGPGPRDGLMTGLAQRGYSIRVARTAIELSVFALGYALGGSVGVGTVVYALGIGPLVHFVTPHLTTRRTS